MTFLTLLFVWWSFYLSITFLTSFDVLIKKKKKKEAEQTDTAVLVSLRSHAERSNGEG